MASNPVWTSLVLLCLMLHPAWSETLLNNNNSNSPRLSKTSSSATESSGGSSLPQRRRNPTVKTTRLHASSPQQRRRPTEMVGWNIRDLAILRALRDPGEGYALAERFRRGADSKPGSSGIASGFGRVHALARQEFNTRQPLEQEDNNTKEELMKLYRKRCFADKKKYLWRRDRGGSRSGTVNNDSSDNNNNNNNDKNSSNNNNSVESKDSFCTFWGFKLKLLNTSTRTKPTTAKTRGTWSNQNDHDDPFEERWS
ncbi:uncharacterized protein LOC143033316 [Oratosquilla oratoria]|uniref:uncharacterized protein LOC143033316 n=1 Tax=Oratosquilla oratoria TaxID=337810 RepID=UPI003F773F17